jgi:hypothetical protein
MGDVSRENGVGVGLLLAVGRARGLCEAGPLSVLLPELERRGQQPVDLAADHHPLPSSLVLRRP